MSHVTPDQIKRDKSEELYRDTIVELRAIKRELDEEEGLPPPLDFHADPANWYSLECDEFGNYFPLDSLRR